MLLDGATEELDSDGRDVWLQETFDLIHNETTSIIGRLASPFHFDVHVAFDEQDVVEGSRVFRRMLLQNHDATTSSAAYIDSETPNRYLRKLQSSSLQIKFTTTIEINSEYDDWDPNQMVAAGFKTAVQQEEYISSLKDAQRASFESVESMTMAVNGEIIT